MPDLDFTALTSGPDPVLAAASDVRARGEQRRQRSRAVVAVAAALVVLASAGTAVALADHGKPNSLQIANPTPTATATAPSVRLATPFDAVLRGEDVARIEGGRWFADVGRGVPGQASLDVCVDHVIPAPARAVGAVVDRKGGILHVEAIRFGSEAEAAAVLAGIRADIARCPGHPFSSPYPQGEGGQSHIQPIQLTGPAVALRRTAIVCSEDCLPRTEYWVIAQVDRLIAFATLKSEAHLQAYVDAVVARLHQATP